MKRTIKKLLKVICFLFTLSAAFTGCQQSTSDSNDEFSGMTDNDNYNSKMILDFSDGFPRCEFTGVGSGNIEDILQTYNDKGYVWHRKKDADSDYTVMESGNIIIEKIDGPKNYSVLEDLDGATVYLKFVPTYSNSCSDSSDIYWYYTAECKLRKVEPEELDYYYPFKLILDKEITLQEIYYTGVKNWAHPFKQQ